MSENNSKILLILLIGFFNAIFVFGQSDSVYFIKVHFVYGSKPLKKYKSTEQKIVGGLHGGHVSIQVEENDYSFEPINRIHIFPHKKNHHSSYVSYKGTKGMRYDTTLNNFFYYRTY